MTEMIREFSAVESAFEFGESSTQFRGRLRNPQPNLGLDATSANDINFFYPKINYKSQFLLHNFHPFFYGSIGTGILRVLNANIDMNSMTLTLSRHSEELVNPLQEYTPPEANNEQFGAV